MVPHDSKSDLPLVICTFFSKQNRFTAKLDTETMEAQLLRSERLSGAEYRAILNKLNDMLIDINAHLESGNRYYNSLFEK